MEEYKPNSFKSKEQMETKKVQQIVTTPVKTVKPTGWDKFKDDLKVAVKFVWTDICLPAAKKSLSEGINNIVDTMIYGEDGQRRGQSVPGSRVSYRSYYESNQRNGGGYSSRPVRSSYNYDEIVLQSRGEADSVLNELDDIIRRYGYAKVADLYDLVGLTGNYTDNNYGWSDLRGAEVIRQRDGYLLKLPKPMPID